MAKTVREALRDYDEHQKLLKEQGDFMKVFGMTKEIFMDHVSFYRTGRTSR